MLFSCLSVFAQQEDSFSNRDSTQQTVSQNRRMLLDKFRAGRLDVVSDLLDSIDYHHSDQSLLWPAERLLLYYWIDRYYAIDSLAFHFDEFCEEALTNPPHEQTVWNVVSLHSFENIDTLITWIDQTGCDDEVFNFRVQLLKTMLNADGDDQTSVHHEIRLLMDLYTFWEEEIQMETQTEIPEQIKSDHWDYDPWRIGFGIGMGPTFVSGNISDFLSVKANLSFALNANYQRWYFLLLMQAIFGNLNRDIPFGNGHEVWEAGKSAITTNIGLALGYSVINGRYLRMSPFIGFSTSECAPSDQQIENNSALIKAGIRRGYACMFGVDSDIKLYHIFSFLERKDAPVSINIRLNYIPAMFSNVNTRYSGNMFLVTFGIGVDVASWR